MSDNPVLSTGHLWALIRGSFSGNMPLPYVQEIFLLECHVAGTSHVNDINLIEPGLSAGNFLMFKREPGNEHDPLAIMILDQKGRKLGYVPQAKNEVLARLMDAGKLVFGKIESLERIEKWLKISIRVYMKDIKKSRSPDISGLTFRGFAGETDYPKMLAVIESSKQADKVERSDSLDNIRRNYKHLINCDPYTDMLFAEICGEVIGYNRVEWFRQDDGVLTYGVIGYLHPDWRRKGIGTAMLQHAEARMRLIAATHEPGPKFFQASVNDGEQGLLSLLESQGYQPARYFIHMTRDINASMPDAPMPPGLEVRLVTEAHYRPIFEADQEAFRDHWGSGERSFEEAFPSWQEDPVFNPALWKVAWDGEQIAGMVLNFVNQAENTEYRRKRGYTEGISVRRPWRKLGLARSLLVQSIAMFKEMGMIETALGVDSENLSGALKLYQDVGYKEVKRNITYRKAMD